MGPVSGVALGAAALYVAWTLRWSFQVVGVWRWGQDVARWSWLEMIEDGWILMNIDEYWWLLVNVDEYWWILMNIDEYEPNLTNIEYIWVALSGKKLFRSCSISLQAATREGCTGSMARKAGTVSLGSMKKMGWLMPMPMTLSWFVT